MHVTRHGPATLPLPGANSFVTKVRGASANSIGKLPWTISSAVGFLSLLNRCLGSAPKLLSR
jgi:hypothetical protein